MKILLFISILSLPFSAIAQLDSESQHFLDDFLYHLRSKDKIIFSNTINKGDLKNMLVAVNKKTIHLDRIVLSTKNSSSLKSTDTLNLTFQEKDFLTKEISKMNGNIWTNNISSTAKLMSQDSIDYFFKNLDLGWAEFHKRIGKSCYQFSKPIFIRSNSICFFFYSVCSDYLDEPVPLRRETAVNCHTRKISAFLENFQIVYIFVIYYSDII